ncbi:ImmA/IrrE family metallo-endopeptidase [Bacillus cereus group sp. Bc005]|uniref:XRE family transcriptional regulator n=1 Tax=unclassified Bacillus cereus group TaxID=2750818 RepID=UPI0022E70AFE|nr:MULTISPECIES: ImmA/IrrE family metallo-endopeptidase [unclassified Bacillus cereus group]MDA2756503.1 ImmA/IrrE family metallo-endopeptidase [Bacillus cereus group sp. Bc007]MDA2762282.1 ImmA/IrrE family metallo-endopeptidase [Bacillus cereus group sp. Bc008]MDA2773301.1 ImmA/IrrE family metallo-endopeptidase [Bacillus cereus group sp. Bc005]
MITSKFNGERLKLARRFNAMSLLDLAEKLSISKQMISKYEKNISPPSGEIMLQLEGVLGFPRKFYFEDDTVTDKVGNAYFRALAKTLKKDLEAQKLRLDFLSIIYQLINEYIELPKENLPTLDIDYMDIEEMAVQAREFWGLGDKPIKNMVELLEVNGIIVSTSRINVAEIDAYTQTRKIDGSDVYFVVLGNDKGSRYRRQFDAAHELAHILIHEPYLDLSTLSKDEEREMEQQANDFASAFLLPKEPFIRDVSMFPTDLDHYVFMKKKWHVSVGVMVRRAYNLGVITFNQYSYLQRQMSKNGWRKKEPLDGKSKPTSPVLIKKSILTLLENDVFDGNSILDTLSNEYQLSLREEMFEALTGLEEGTLAEFRNDSSNVVLALRRN